MPRLISPTRTFLAIACLVSIALVGSPLTAAEAEPAPKPGPYLEAIATLKAHITGDETLTDEQLDELTKQIKASQPVLMGSENAVRASMDLVQTHEAERGALWLTNGEWHKKRKAEGDSLRWAVFWVMQNLMDALYSNAGLDTHRELLDGYRFGSADHFPGKVGGEPFDSYTVKIDGSYPETWGSPVFHMDRPARKPTGAYLVPGSIATVEVPQALVDKGYQVRVGAHSWDLTKKPRITRLYRVSAVYDIDRPVMEVANPLGGGIYIEVPYKADAGVVEVTIKNPVRSPYFSWKDFHKTSLEEWREVERHHKAPWADFQSEKYMMQVPTSWVYALDDPVTLMKNWDKSLDVVSDLFGKPRDFGREVLYNQVDLQLRGRAFHPGYPSGNRMYKPGEDYGGNFEHHLIQGPQAAHSYEFHELGHGMLFPKYPGQREAAVNLPHVAVMHQAFGQDIDQAFRSSRDEQNEFRTVDTTAIAWMMSDHFVDGSGMRGYEAQYQLKGHARYVDIVRLFDWGVIEDFFRSTEEDHMAGNPWPRNVEDSDRYTLRMSEQAGVDLRPLIHFWGVPALDDEKSDAAVGKAGLKKSAKVYDLLMKYKKLVPEDQQAFRAFARDWWGKQPSPEGYTTERNHARRWEEYDPELARQTRQAVQAIIDRYFPDGRP